jgi:hypothetical protein
MDLLYPVSMLATRQHYCTTMDEEALSQLVNYLKRTKDWNYTIAAPPTITLECSADASYATHADGRGHSGYVCSIGGNTIFARSIKQKVVTKSSTEAELLALNLAADHVLYLREFLKELGHAQPGPTVIKQDNRSAMVMAKKGEIGSKRTKHFTVRHYFIKEHLESGELTLAYEPGETISADGLTKLITGPRGQAWAKALLHQDQEKMSLKCSTRKTHGGVLGNKDVLALCDKRKSENV